MWDFGRADMLEPEALGDPGARTFRLRVMSRGEAASLWLEKEQLAALTLAIRQLLEQTSVVDDEDDVVDRAGFPEPPRVEFKIGRLGIGYNESDRLVAIFAYTIEDDEDALPSFSCNVSRHQCRTFAERAEHAIAGGRPICVLCGGPIDQGSHRCLRRNGHSTVQYTLDE